MEIKTHLIARIHPPKTVKSPPLPPFGTEDIQPMIANNCSTCHVENGAAPFVFEQFEDVEPLAPVMLSSMQSGSMPPWLPNPDCIDYQNERLLKD